MQDPNNYILKRGLPECPETELQILAILIEEPKTALEVLTENNIDFNSFYSPINQHLYQDITKIIDDGHKIDVSVLVDCLRKRNHSPEAIKKVVPKLLEDFAPASYLNYHIKNIKLYLKKREAIQAGAKLIDQGYNVLILDDFLSDKKSLTDEIKQYIENTTGNFNNISLDCELNISTKELKSNRRVIIHRLIKDNVIEKTGTQTGNYRKIGEINNEILWQKANINDSIDLKLPFDIDKLIYIFPKNIIIIAGEKDAGKTAFLLNVIRANMQNFEIVYLSSEMMEIEMASRLDKFENINKNEWEFKAFECSDNFHDHIKSDAINLIDFLEIGDEFWKINEKIKRIYDKLTTGIAIIGIQKKKGAEYARGAEFSMEKARLYITLQAGNPDKNSELKIVSAKNPRAEKPPRGKIIEYKLVQGCKFIEQTTYKPIIDSYKNESRQYKD